MNELRELAKFFDIHGSVGLYPQSSGRVKVRVAITKASPAYLKRFKDYFEVGTVAGYPQFPPHRYYSYVAYSKNAQKVLESLAPYLIHKKAVALEALTELAKEHTISA